jgi:Ca2+-binding RTX toxin-like protein
MRRAVFLVVVAAAVLALAGGVVLAESKLCATLDCVGTRGADTMTGRDNASDRIAGMEGDDQIDGGGGSDTVYGDEGNDTIHVEEFNGAAAGDTVNCGPGAKDRVFFDKGVDTIHNSCEIRKPAQQ